MTVPTTLGGVTVFECTCPEWLFGDRLCTEGSAVVTVVSLSLIRTCIELRVRLSSESAYTVGPVSSAGGSASADVWASGGCCGLDFWLSECYVWFPACGGSVSVSTVGSTSPAGWLAEHAGNLVPSVKSVSAGAVSVNVSVPYVCDGTAKTDVAVCS